ncbi:MAG TPA: succinylglutamate desuccinylase/aspartoacylase family protein [Candidatus Didemnitutus sp.]|nr:succinylglutamate desuccinylase/aspartoacylase family protein [Candidatus Didemnitutus sp.]
MLQSSPSVHPQKLRRLYWPFLALAEECREVVGVVAGSFEGDAERRYTIPRFTFLGPQGNLPQLRLGLFALLHGDEPAGAQALLRLLETLIARPELATGYDLVCYPVCNPTGFEDATRENRAGLDLNREFWRGSAQPEIQILESELREQRFDGVIALHADDTSDGLYGYAHGRTLNEQLLAPALRESARILPRNCGVRIDGFAANEGIIDECFEGILAAPPEQRPQPFEIIFETPGRAPVDQQAEAAHYALLAMLREHRGFVAQGGDL